MPDGGWMEAALFGAGAVISAVSVDLVAVSYDEAGALPTAIGIGIGCLIYFGIIALPA